MTLPVKSAITNWSTHHMPNGGGFVVIGLTRNDPTYRDGMSIKTSLVKRLYTHEGDVYCETLNNLYRLES